MYIIWILFQTWCILYSIICTFCKKKNTILYYISDNNTTVALYVTLEQNVIPSSFDVLKYNKVVVDTVYGYNPMTGVYTVQSDGVYLFKHVRCVLSMTYIFGFGRFKIWIFGETLKRVFYFSYKHGMFMYIFPYTAIIFCVPFSNAKSKPMQL